MDQENSAHETVGELQGLYGPFTFPEKLLQKVWLRGEFDHERALTADGRKVRIVYAGRWNRLGGPDFKGARLTLDGVPVTGDIELHLRISDWRTHGHAQDPAYDQVVLHVVLFAGESPVTVGSGGRVIPLLVLLPLLHYALEDYAADAAVEKLADRSPSRALDDLAALPREERLSLLQGHAAERWRQKLHFAGLRVARLGWSEACHQTALEIFGYRFNRTPMLRISGAFPLSVWSRDASPVEEAYAREAGRWSVQGVRPANRPLVRLRQYAGWARAMPTWPTTWSEWMPPEVSPIPRTGTDFSLESRAFRDDLGQTAVRRILATTLCGDVLSGPRFDTLVCNALLPFRATFGAVASAQSLWYHWLPGDMPPQLVKVLQQLDLISHRQPLCHGLAQGLLGWWIRHEKTCALESVRS